jgi:replicative DNA helicase
MIADSRKTYVNIAPLFDEKVPSEFNAEATLLGTMLKFPEAIGDVVEVVNPGMFWKPANVVIYEAIIHLYEKNKAIQPETVMHRLKECQQLTTLDGGLEAEKTKGVDYLIYLLECNTVWTAAKSFAEIVRDAHKKRQIVEVCGKALNEVYKTPTPVDEQLDTLESNVFVLRDVKSSTEPESAGSLMQTAYKHLETSEGLQEGLQTGFWRLDELLGGGLQNDYIIIGARPSQGKTALLMQMAEQIALNIQPQPIGVFSLEMSKQALAMRMLASVAEVDGQKLRRNMCDAVEFNKLAAAVGKMEKAPLYIDDTSNLTVMGIRSRARRMVQRYGIKAVFIDYLQLCQKPKAENVNHAVGEMSRQFKAMSRELNMPVVVLSQLNRGPEDRDIKRPRLSDLRDSGNLEQDADVVLLLHREDYYKRGDPNARMDGMAEIIIAKQRNGPCETVNLNFNEKTTRFGNPQ